MIEVKYDVEKTIEIIEKDMEDKEEYNKRLSDMGYNELFREVKQKDSILIDAKDSLNNARYENNKLHNLVRLLAVIAILLCIALIVCVGIADKKIIEAESYVSTEINFDSMTYHTINYIEPGAYIGYPRFGNGPIYLRITEDGDISIEIYEVRKYENGYADIEDGPSYTYSGSLQHASDMVNGSYFRSDDTTDNLYALDVDSQYCLTIKPSFTNTDIDYLDPIYTEYWKVSE